MRSNVSALIITGVEDANMQLVDDEIVKRWRAETLVMPRVGLGIADDAVADWVAAQLQLTRPGVALEAGALRADDEEPIQGAVRDAGAEASPVAGDRILEQFVGRPRLIVGGAANCNINVCSAGCPDSEAGAVGDEVGTHGGRAADVLLGCGHV